MARGRFANAKSQVQPPNEISSVAQQFIQDIIDELTSATREPNREIELDEIKRVCRNAPIKRIKPNRVDIWLEDSDGNK